jgi:hypothetical protein
VPFGLHLLVRTFASPCFGCEPKAKVVTKCMTNFLDDKKNVLPKIKKTKNEIL